MYPCFTSEGRPEFFSDATVGEPPWERATDAKYTRLASPMAKRALATIVSATVTRVDQSLGFGSAREVSRE